MGSERISAIHKAHVSCRTLPPQKNRPMSMRDIGYRQEGKGGNELVYELTYLEMPSTQCEVVKKGNNI